MNRLILMTYRIKKKWMLLLVFILLSWTAGIVTAPLIAPSPVYWQSRIAKILYFIYQPTCHQFPERSFSIKGFPFTVCVRCFAVYMTGLLLAVFYTFQESIRMFKLSVYFILTIFPLTDFLLEKINLYHNLNLPRFFTGAILGFILFHLLIVGISEVEDEKKEICSE